MAKIEAAAVRGSVLYTGEFTGYDGLSRYGKHAPIDRGGGFAGGPAHINGIEGLWGYAEGLHRPCRGVDRENFPTDLAEYESRYNHRDDHRIGVLFEAPIRPHLIKDGLA